ncbi:hypothetical protein GCM10023089_00650 [Quisquiliibacterium transsilvanicum]
MSDTGIARQLICTAIAQGRAANERQLMRTLSSTLGGSHVSVVVGRMIRDGLLFRLRGGALRVTPLGAKLVPSAQPSFSRDTYVPPPPPPRREGSMDFATRPSVAAGAPRPWRGPC